MREIQDLIMNSANCRGVRERLKQLKHAMTARKFNLKRCNPKKIKPDAVAIKLLANLVFTKWCVNQIKVNERDSFPLGVGDRIFSFAE